MRLFMPTCDVHFVHKDMAWLLSVSEQDPGDLYITITMRSLVWVHRKSGNNISAAAAAHVK